VSIRQLVNGSTGADVGRRLSVANRPIDQLTN